MEPMDQVSKEPLSKEESSLALKGIAQVFYAPSEFFSKLRNQPKIVVPYIVYAILVAAFFLLVVDYIVELQMDTPQVQEQIDRAGMSEEQMRGIMKMTTLGGGMVAMLIVPVLGALLGMFWGNFVFAGKATFSQILSVMLYGEILYIIGALLHVPLIIAKDSMMVSYSLAVLAADQGMDSIAYVALSKISVFHIWEIIAVGIGLSAVYGIGRNKGYIISVLSVGLLAVLHVLMTAVGSMFS